ncbi:FAD binding domain-containing protein [Curvivirga aplysinae]|uniref:FAD binding domain-containing protein n=1 Tax=Curvivirga aplysinae TaxID=2529852 RepID=UPI0012BCB49F|nr:xanthine dehydrogenase family protein subunit M [Curvivirga aplysinae]MTI09276.1 xanthine dehydrogenase family protein subunit M [Curvivirga aplysinae]
MYEFNYDKANSAADAASKLAASDDGKVLAGGQTLIPTMKQRLAAPEDVIDLASAGLSGIAVDGDIVVIGAMTTHATVASSSDVQSVIPALAELAGNIGDNQVRTRGTIGGSIANNDPAADYPAACMGLGATIITTKRGLSAEEFFTGLFETALDEDEIITAVKFPKVDSANYQKFPNPASRYALAGVFVAKTGSEVRVAVTGAGNDGVFRAHKLEEALAANFSADVVDISPMPEDSMIEDLHASAAYRKNLIGVMTKRAVQAC